jgi:hypothetical protein
MICVIVLKFLFQLMIKVVPLNYFKVFLDKFRKLVLQPVAGSFTNGGNNPLKTYPFRMEYIFEKVFVFFLFV